MQRILAGDGKYVAAGTVHVPEVKEGTIVRMQTARMIGVFLLLTLLLAACGGGEQPSQQGQTPPASTDNTTQTPASDPKPTGNLVIYTAAAKTTADLIVNEWYKVYPDVKIEVISAGSGELLTRIQAEAARPQGDIILAVGYENLDTIKDLLQPYKTKHDADYKDSVKDPDGYYYGYSYNLQAFIVNTEMLDESDYPRTWKDLADPKYAGEIIMANPAQSGSATAQLWHITSLYGWDLAEEVAQNTVFVSSSKLVFQNVARGEQAIGITGEGNVLEMQREGYPVVAVYPEDGTAERFDATAIIKNGPNGENAKLFMDWITGPEIAQVLGTQETRRLTRDGAPTPEGLAPTSEIKFIPYDSEYLEKHGKEMQQQFEEILSRKQ